MTGWYGWSRAVKTGSGLQCNVISQGRYFVLLCDGGNLYCEKCHAGVGRTYCTADLQLTGNDRENCDRGDAGSHVRIPGVIAAEPIVWFIMIIPLLIKILRMPVWKQKT